MPDGAPNVEELWTRYAPLVLRRCRQLLRDEQDALDVCQDVFLQLLRRRETLDIQFPSSLIYRMATNLCLNRIRDRRHWPDLVEDNQLARIARLDDPSAEVHARSVLGRLFAQHRESTRMIAMLHYVDGLTLEEVACEVGLSVSGVRKRLRALRAKVEELEGM
jgi:RNA polymerase sigma-70 factor (ECF subfamily)